jgi:hypothetical protein
MGSNVFNVIRDVEQLHIDLPLLPEEASMCFVYEQNDTPNEAVFKINKERVVKALEWLIANHEHYKKLDVRLCPERVANLPTEVDPSRVKYINLETGEEVDPKKEAEKNEKAEEKNQDLDKTRADSKMG